MVSGMAPLAMRTMLGIDLAHRLGEEVVLDRVLREGHVAVLVGAPHLVADVPELDAIGLGMAVGGALGAPGRRGGAVGVFDVLGGGAGIAEAGVDGDVGLDVRQPAQGHELVGADVVGLHGAPDGVPDGRALVGIADGVAPVVGGDEVAAGPAIDARAKGLEHVDDFAPPAVDVVRGHQRNGADAQGAGAGGGDLDLAVVGVDRALEGERELGVGGGQLADGQRLAVSGAGSPDEADRHLGGRIAGEDDAAGIGLVAQQRQPRLADAARLAGAERDRGGVVADVGVPGVHGDGFGRADGGPAARWAAKGPRRGVLPAVRPVGLGGDRVEELAVVDHLSPHAAVHEAAGVFDEHAVEVGIDGSERLAGVDDAAY